MADGNLWSLMALLREEGIERLSLADAPPPVREGEAFAHAMAHAPIGIPEGAALAGDLGWHWCSPEEQERLQSVTRNPKSEIRNPAICNHQSAICNLNDWFHCFPSSGGDAHTTADYERVVTEGLCGILAEIEREGPSAPPIPPNVGGDRGGRRADTLHGMRAALQGVIRWSERYAELAEAQAAPADAPERDRLLAIAGWCRRVPRAPARSFAEALQSVWLIHLAVGLSEHSGASLSLGRLDQYLHPLYRQDLARGIPEADLEDALAGLFRALNAFWGDPACTINLGGLDARGNCLLNDLSRMILRVAKRLRLPAPILAARIHDRLSPEDFGRFLDPALFEMGQPTFYGEDPCRRALVRRGVPEAEVHAWAANSCMGLLMPGQEWSNMWGSVINILLPLELALNAGRPFHRELPLPLPVEAPPAHARFESLFESVCAYTAALVDLLIAETARRTEERGQARPNPFVSALHADCIAQGEDRLLGGCRYQTVIVEAFGLVNVSDALLAVRRLVFEEGRFSLAELVEAAKANFEGRPDLLHALRSAPKFGSGDPEADAIARRLAGRFAQAVSRHSSGSLTYAPSFHTLSAHIIAGAKMGASLDGRLAVMPLAKNVGTSPGRAAAGHTALMQSAAALDQGTFPGGQALDIWVDPGLLRTPEGRRKFGALLLGYFRLGGLQVQVNAVSVDTLRKALDDPASHRDVLVRKAGYSIRFVDLGRPEQLDLIERFTAGV